MPQYNMCSQMRIHNAINPRGKSIPSAQQTGGQHCGEHREVTAASERRELALGRFCEGAKRKQLSKEVKTFPSQR